MPDDLRRRLAPILASADERRPLPPRASAVLAPLVPAPAGARLLLTRRAAHLTAHPGELSFPGGRLERADAGPLSAALRETEEETGLAPRQVEVLGHLLDYTTFRGETVCAYVGLVPARVLEQATAASREVEELLVVRVAELLEPGAPFVAAPSGRRPREARVVGYEGRALGPEIPAAGPRTVHYWRLATGRPLWGITGDLVAHLLSRAWGWSPPRPARIIHRREDVEP